MIRLPAVTRYAWSSENTMSNRFFLTSFESKTGNQFKKRVFCFAVSWSIGCHTSYFHQIADQNIYIWDDSAQPSRILMKSVSTFALFYNFLDVIGISSSSLASPVSHLENIAIGSLYLNPIADDVIPALSCFLYHVTSSSLSFAASVSSLHISSLSRPFLRTSEWTFGLENRYTVFAELCAATTAAVKREEGWKRAAQYVSFVVMFGTWLLMFVLRRPFM